MRAIEQYFLVAKFIMLYKVVLTLNEWLKSHGVTIQMKAIEQYFLVVLFILFPTFESVGKILKHHHSK